jgi:hypothetical protein
MSPRPRSAFVAPLLVLLVAPLIGGCKCFCAMEQWKCDTFGCCQFGTSPSYGTFAPAGPMPQPQYGPVYTQPTTGGYNGGFVQPGVQYGQPVEIHPGQPSLESF